MDRKTKREVVTALVKAGRRDLAEQLVLSANIIGTLSRNVGQHGKLLSDSLKTLEKAFEKDDSEFAVGSAAAKAMEDLRKLEGWLKHVRSTVEPYDTLKRHGGKKRKAMGRTVVTAGYTHYWRPPGKPAFSDDQWKKLVAGVKKIVAAARKKGIQIAGPLGTGKVVYKNDMIALNGQEPDYGESFVLKRDLDDFGFCKTGERPYDDVVVSILALARKLAPELVFLSSDGGDGVFNNPPFKA